MADEDGVSVFAGETKAEPLTAADVPGLDQGESLREYWVHGKGALKIRWGQPGDWRRCIRNVRKYSKGGAEFDPEGYCANLHHEALGVWPGREHGKKVHTAINPNFERLHPRFRGMFAKKGEPTDALKLTDRAPIGEGERVIGTSRLGGRDGDAQVVAAVIDRPTGPVMRIGVVADEDVPRWRGAFKGGTVELDEAQLTDLQAQMRNAVEAAERFGAESKANAAAWDKATRRREKILAEHSPKDVEDGIKEYDELFAHLRNRRGPISGDLYYSRQPDAPEWMKAREPELAKRVADIDASMEEIKGRRAALDASRIASLPENARNEYEALQVQMARLLEFETDAPIASGSVAGRGGTITFDLGGIDGAEGPHGWWGLDLDVVPDGPDDMSGNPASIRDADARKFVDSLTMGGAEPTTAALGQDNNPAFNKLHPRFKGRFASKPGASLLAGIADSDRHEASTYEMHEALYGPEYDSERAFQFDRLAQTDFGRTHGLKGEENTARGLYVGVYGHGPNDTEGQIFVEVGDDENRIVAIDGLSAESMREMSQAVFNMYNDDFQEEFDALQESEGVELDPFETVLDEEEIDGFRVQRMGTGDLRIIADEDNEDGEADELLRIPIENAEEFEATLDNMASSLEEFYEEAQAEGATTAALDVSLEPLPGELWHAVAHVEDISTGKRTWVPGAITWREPPFAFHTEMQSSAHGSPMTTVQVGLVTRVLRDGNSVHSWGTVDLDSDLGLDFGRRLAQGFARWVSMDPDETPIAYDLVMPSGSTGLDTEPEQVVFYSYRLAGLTSVSMPAQEGSYLEPTPALAAALAERGVTVASGADKPVTAAAVAPHDTPTTDKPWDADANVGRLPSPMSVETARKVFAWIDESRVEDGMLPHDAAKMPHHLVSEDGTPGAADLTACSAGIAALNGARSKPDIPAADFAGVYKHLAAHLRDAGREDVPTLTTGIDTHDDGINTCTCMGQDGKMIHPGKCDLTPDGPRVGEHAPRRAPHLSPKAMKGSDRTSKGDKLRMLLKNHVAKLPENRLDWSGADRRKAVALEKAIHLDDLRTELDGLEKRLGAKRLTWPRKERLRGRAIDDELNKLLAKGTGVTVASNVHVLELPDLPPAEWFEEPAEMDAEPGGPIRITDDGRIYGWLVPENIGHRTHARNGQRKTFKDLGNIDFSRWLNETIVAGGTRVLAGPITMDCDHAPTQGYGTLANRNKHYENTCSIVGRVATGVGTRHKGQWIAGALMPWITPQQFTTILASRMSGDWQPHPEKRGWQEFIAALVVPVAGWPGSRTAITTASALAPVYSIQEDEESCWVASASVPITAAGCGCYVIDDEDEEVEAYDLDDEEPWDMEGAPDMMPWRADPAILDMYASDLGLDKRSRMREYARMLG